MEAKPYLIIKPKKGWQLIDFKELREYRDLFYFLVDPHEPGGRLFLYHGDLSDGTQLSNVIYNIQ